MSLFNRVKIYLILQWVLPKPIWSYLRRLKRVTVRRFSRQVTKNELIESLVNAGIGSGDILYVYSSLSRIGNVANGAKDVIDSLQEVITSKGTLAFPCHLPPRNVIDGYKNGEILNLRSSTVQTGTIPTLALSMANVKRSSHPFASSCAIGKDADYLTNGHDLDPRICHIDSPLARLLSLKGKLVGLGTDFAAIGFYHVIEDIEPRFPLDVYMPPEEISYFDYAGRNVTRFVRVYDPSVSISRIERPDGNFIRNLLLKHFRKIGLLKEFKFGNANSWIMCTEELHNELKKLLDNGITIYTTQSDYERLGVRL